ncbi:cob(I)yrinic acid a,c-diamide adenosyltransferase [Aquibacillus sediminis]|uniref:cob(I)yrinic acid a,c-diamide adenosyltransferase n=1 Tax=Aquibacillus sediminis TaxID=2574734 RepID=UPI0011090FA9|nr:cob(I)yrinic acid a,c-diamide adenosyltransferase [Aquibacillus sediminis]
MRIYTKTGDEGTTSLVYGKRVAKNDIRVEAYGTCDEANSMIGLAISYLHAEVNWEDKQEFIDSMHRIQSVLFHVGAELSTPSDKEVKWKLTEAHVQDLEKQIDQWDSELAPLKQFILPSGHPTAAGLHTARTIIRRAERTAVVLKDELGSSLVLAYLNRLSDFLFVAARFVNQKCGGKEIPLRIND